MLQAGEEPNVRGDTSPLRDGLELAAVNTAGGVAADRLKIMDRFGKFTPVGFYYKAFHKPKFLFPFFEKRIRAVAGLGSVKGAAFNGPCSANRQAIRLLRCPRHRRRPGGIERRSGGRRLGLQGAPGGRTTHPGGSLLYQGTWNREGDSLGAELVERVIAISILSCAAARWPRAIMRITGWHSSMNSALRSPSRGGDLRDGCAGTTPVFPQQ